MIRLAKFFTCAYSTLFTGNILLVTSTAAIPEIFSGTLNTENTCESPPIQRHYAKIVFRCPDKDNPGRHNYWSPFLHSRIEEQSALQHSKYSAILERFTEFFYRDNHFRNFIKKSDIEAVNKIQEKRRNKELLSYKEYGCSPENIWDRNTSTNEVKSLPNGVYHVKSGTSNVCMDDRSCSTMTSIDEHERAHLELGFQDHISKIYLNELIPSLEQQIFNYLDYKEKEEVFYNKTLTVWGKNFPLVEFVHFYYLLKQTQTTSNALLSRNSILYLTGIDLHLLDIQDEHIMDIISNHIEEIRDIINTTNIDLKSLSSLSDEEKLQKIIFNALSSDQVSFLYEIGLGKSDQFLKFLDKYGIKLFTKHFNTLKFILENSTLNLEQTEKKYKKNLLRDIEYTDILLKNGYSFEDILMIIKDSWDLHIFSICAKLKINT